MRTGHWALKVDTYAILRTHSVNQGLRYRLKKLRFYFSAGMTNFAIGNFVHQNINSHSKFEGIDELMCNSFKIKSLLHKLTLNRAAGKDGIFAEHISYADSSVCNHLSSLFRCVFNAWQNSSGMHANSHSTHLQKQEWELK